MDLSWRPIPPKPAQDGISHYNWHHASSRPTATTLTTTASRRGDVVLFLHPPHLELRVTVRCFTTAHLQDHFFLAFLLRLTRLACTSASSTPLDIDALADEVEGSFKLTSNGPRSCGPSLVGDRHRRWHKVGCRL